MKLREELLQVEEDRVRGAKDYELGEVVSMMREAAHEVCHAGA